MFTMLLLETSNIWRRFRSQSSIESQRISTALHQAEMKSWAQRVSPSGRRSRNREEIPMFEAIPSGK
jgi:hypothetical protein